MRVKSPLLIVPGLLVVLVAGCSNESRKSPDVTSNLRKSLDQAGLQNIHVSQDRVKGVVTLTGNVQSEQDKARATTIAKSGADGQVVASEVAVVPPNDNEAKSINSDYDKAIGKDLDAALRQNSLSKGVRYDVQQGVVTLKGQVNSESLRAQAGKIAAGVPHVQQVVNELDVKNQRATSSGGF